MLLAKFALVAYVIIKSLSAFASTEKLLLTSESPVSTLPAPFQLLEPWFIVSVCLMLVIIYLLRVNRRIKRQLNKYTDKNSQLESPNRKQILDTAKLEFNSAQRYKYPLTITIIEIDHFKQELEKSNNSSAKSSSEETAEVFMENFSSICQKIIREQDSFGRYSIEEWLLVFPHTNITEADTILQRIRADISNLCISNEKAATFSAGLTELDEQDITLKDLIKRADDALFIAKEQGRNRSIVS